MLSQFVTAENSQAMIEQISGAGSLLWKTATSYAEVATSYAGIAGEVASSYAGAATVYAEKFITPIPPSIRHFPYGKL